MLKYLVLQRKLLTAKTRLINNMIYSQDFYHYAFSLAAFILLAFRLRVFFSEYFTNSFSQIVISAILFHPLSIDAFFLPNVFTGALSFLLFIEAMILLKKEKPTIALFLFFLSSVFNIAYCLLPVYFFSRNYHKLSKLLPLAVTYIVFLIIFILGNFLNGIHNPFVFFTYFIQALIVPYPVHVVNFGLFPFSKIAFTVSIFILFIFYFIQTRKKILNEYLPLLFLPLIGVILVPWSYGYHFWSDVFFSPSSYMVITFSFIFFLAQSIPKKAFYLYFFVTFLLSLYWITHFFPFSNAINASLENLPSGFAQDTTSIKRLLMKQYFFENKIEESKNLGLQLLIERPGNIDIKNDLIDLKLIPIDELE